MELRDSYHNWIGRLDLVCASGSKIGFIGSSFFIGWFISLTFVPRLADLYGRKKLMVFGVWAQLITYCFIMTTTCYSTMICALITSGMLSTISVQICIIYMFEHMPKRLVASTMTYFFVL